LCRVAEKDEIESRCCNFAANKQGPPAPYWIWLPICGPVTTGPLAAFRILFRAEFSFKE